jgi:Lectin C-type domain
MKKHRAFILAAMILAMVIGHSHADILAGPITNSANGHEYYLLSPNTWSESEAEAETLGGTLAVIRSSAEQDWVLSHFGDYVGTNSRSLWFGFHRNSPGGAFVAVTDVPVNYFNWNYGEPNNAGGNENFVQMLPTGKWNDNQDGANPVCGLVEVPGKSNETTLTAQEKALIGDWYDNGNPNQRCYIIGTDNRLYAIDENRGASRIILTPEGCLFSPHWKQHMVVQDDKILWSWGNWWSRQPVPFKTMPKVPAPADSGPELKTKTGQK